VNKAEDPKRSFVKYSTLGFQIVGFMAIFGVLGYLADGYFTYERPVFLIFGLLFGVVASLIYLIRSLTQKQ